MKKRPYAIALLSAILLFNSLNVHAQRDTARVGMFITSLYDFRIPERSFKTDFWLWVLYKDKKLSFDKTMEVPYSKEYSFESASLDSSYGQKWLSMRGRAEVREEWDIKKYPFDKHTLNIHIESTEYDASQVYFLADTKNSKINPDVKLAEWNIESVKFSNEEINYQTTYGNPKLEGKSTYPSFKATIELSRQHSWLILMKLITGVIVAFLVSCSVFYINPLNADPRFGLCVGGLFVVIGNKYIVEGIIPSNNSTTLLDNIHNVTILFILFTIIISIVSLNWMERGPALWKGRSKKLDRISFFGMMTLYFMIIGGLIAAA